LAQQSLTGKGLRMLNIITPQRPTVTAVGGKLGTVARRVTRYRAATAHPIEVPAEADGIPGTVVRRVTPYRAATAHPIKVQSATRRADGMATELKRPQAQRLSDWQTARRPVCHAGILPRKFPASDVVPVGVAGDHLSRGNCNHDHWRHCVALMRFHSSGTCRSGQFHDRTLRLRHNSASRV